MLIRRSVAVAATVIAATTALAGSASAHVTVPEPGTKGGFSIVTFSVPNERDDAGTVTLEVQLPEDHPLAFVSVQPKPGWTVSTTTRMLDEPIDAFGEQLTEVVDTVTWTGGPIEPGQFDTFSLSVGPLPDDIDALEFPAIQTYSSGEEVAWIEETPEGGEEPEHPAPVLALLDAGEDGATGDVPDEGEEADEGDTGTDEGDEQAAAADSESDDDDGTDAVAVAGLIIAIIAAGLGGFALVRSGRRS